MPQKSPPVGRNLSSSARLPPHLVAEPKHGSKAKAYRTLPSLQEYLLVSQTEPWIVHDFRGADGQWSFDDVTGLEATLSLKSVPVEISLAEIYRDVEFDEATS